MVCSEVMLARLSESPTRPGNAKGRPSGTASRTKVLAAQPQALGERAVTRDIDVLQVTKQATALTDQQQQATTRVVVVLVRLQVLGEVLDAAREHRDLDLRGSSVARVSRVLFDYRLLDICVQSHGCGSLLF